MARLGIMLPAPLYGLGQCILTWITGKALPGQKPINGNPSPWWHLFSVLFILLGSAALSVRLWTLGGYYLVLSPVTVGLTLSASRTLWLMDLHAAAHGSFSRTRWANKAVGDAVSWLLMVLPHQGYRTSHCIDHHSPGTFCSPDRDPDGSFLCWMGLGPGTPRPELWRRLVIGLLSPKVHLVFLAARLKSNLFNSGWRRSLASLLYLALLGYLAAQCGWMAILMSWVLPIGLLYQISAIMGWVGEHAWFEPPTSDRAAWHNARTHARFFGLPYPHARSFHKRLLWGMRMLGHAVLRFLIVPGDLPNHDWHHRHPSSREWVHAAYAREVTIAAGERYSRETWGLIMAMNHGLASIAAQARQIRDEAFGARDAMLTFGSM